VRAGRRLAIDVGTVRIGVAACDAECIIASGLETLSRGPEIAQAIDSLLILIAEVNPIEIYVGLPANLSGSHSSSTIDAIGFAKHLQARTPISVRFIDERLTSVTANSNLRASGKSAKNSRHVVDQVAATIILEQALSIEKSSGLVPGKSIEEIDG
jgi:putative Holliday junction resolvase